MEKQLLHFNVPKICYDTVATSGDSARVAMFTGVVGKKIFFIGEPRDQLFFEPISIIKSPIKIEQVSIQNAEGIVCTGPFDGSADPSVNKEDFLFGISKSMKFLCANPDIVVERAKITTFTEKGRISEKNLARHLGEKSSKTEKTEDSSDSLISTDNQLYEALTLLKGLDILSRNSSLVNNGNVTISKELND